ncbi:MAG: KR domain-containing protein, partial [Acetobacteraceae bacterium]|nr:KR domain-containing protein [Acetobacteraceae bacterium]
GMPLDAFILFSSAVTVLGSAGQANYAAANACMEAVARARSARGAPALFVAWGPWADGMAAADRVRRRTGAFEPMPAQAAFAQLERLMASQAAGAAVLPLRSWSAFFEAHPQEAADPFFREIRPEQTETGTERDVVQALRAVAGGGRRRALLGHLAEQAARVLGIADPQSIDASVPLQERGLDSLMSVELRNALVKSLGVRLPPTVALDYPTLDVLCDRIGTELFADASPAAPVPDDAAFIAGLSETDAEAMLRRELEELDA